MQYKPVKISLMLMKALIENNFQNYHKGLYYSGSDKPGFDFIGVNNLHKDPYVLDLENETTVEKWAQGVNEEVKLEDLSPEEYDRITTEIFETVEDGLQKPEAQIGVTKAEIVELANLAWKNTDMSPGLRMKLAMGISALRELEKNTDLNPIERMVRDLFNKQR